MELGNFCESAGIRRKGFLRSGFLERLPDCGWEESAPWGGGGSSLGVRIEETVLLDCYKTSWLGSRTDPGLIISRLCRRWDGSASVERSANPTHPSPRPCQSVHPCARDNSFIPPASAQAKPAPNMLNPSVLLSPALPSFPWACYELRLH